MSAYFPFHALGLHCNPFRALTDDEWGDLALLPGELAALDPAAHVQILGERGYGKTSVLMGLLAESRRAGKKAGYEYLAAGQSRFQTPLAGLDLFLLDEAQRLSPRERDRLMEGLLTPDGAARLVLGSHEDLASLFAARRLRLASLRLAPASVDHLRAVVERRLTYFALPGGPGISVTPEALDHLHRRFGGNLRAIEQLLYEACQHISGPGEITAELLAALSLPLADETAPE